MSNKRRKQNKNITNGRKKKADRREVSRGRNFLVLFVLSCVLVLIAYNSLNVGKYAQVYEYPDSGSAYGYSVDGNNYAIEDEQEHYIEYAYAAKPLRIFYMYFGNAMETDMNISAEMYLGEKKVDTVNTVIHPDDGCLKLYLRDMESDRICISTDQGFQLSDAFLEYTGPENSTAPLRNKMILLFAALLVISVFAAGASFVDRAIKNMYGRASELLSTGKENYKKILLLLFKLSASCVCGNAVWAAGVALAWRGRWTVSRDTVLFGCMIGVLGYLLIHYFLRKNMTFERLFLYCGLLVMTVMAVILPLRLNVSWDDQIHFMNSTLVSHLSDSTISLSEEDYYYTCYNYQLQNYENWEPAKLRQIINNNEARRLPAQGSLYDVFYKLFVYLPMSLALFFARGLCLPMSVCILLGRMAGAWFYVFLIYRGMKHLKSGKWIMAAVALMPGAVFLVSNYNYDYWLIALTAYSIAYLVGEYQRPEKLLEWKDILLIFGSFLIAIINKPVYIPLLGLAAFFPKQKFKTDRFRRIYRGLFGGLVVCAVLGFAVLLFGGFLGTGDARGGEGVNAGLQIQYILSHPGSYTKILLSYLKGYLSLHSLKDYVADMAYFGRIEWLGMPCLVWLLLITLADRDLEGSRQIRWYVKAAVIPLAFAAACCVATAMYVVFTPVGYGTVLGCQGRYLWPVISPLLLTLTQVRFLKIPGNDMAKRITEITVMAGTLVLAGIMMTVFL